MSISGYFSKSSAPLRMPRCTPGVPDANGVVFHGPVLTGHVDVATALHLNAARIEALLRHPDIAARLYHDAVLDPLANRISPAPSPARVAPALDADRVSTEPRQPASRQPAQADEAGRILARFRDPYRR